MKSANTIFSLILLLLLVQSCQQDPKKEAEALAQQWCSCNQGLIPLHQKLEAAQTPQDRQTVLDSMHSLVVQNMQCLGGESKWVKKDQQMNSIQKDKFLKTFRRVKEEVCPEVFQVIAALEAAIEPQ